VKRTVTLGGALAAIVLLGACASRDSAGTIPPGTDGTLSHALAPANALVFPSNVRSSCPSAEPGGVRCFALVRRDVGGANRPISGYAPADLQAAYNLPSSTNGTGQTVTIVASNGYPKAEQDMGTYRSHFGLPPCTTANGCFKKYNQHGQQGAYPPISQGWDEQQALDLDMVSAICPNCKIVLVEANKPSQQSLANGVDEAVKLGATIISIGYGMTTKTGESDYDHSGVTIVAASGESGFGTQTPAGFPSVVSVGGTTLTKGGSGRGWSETAWSYTGSGCTSFPKPTWQTDKRCKNRTMNDVAVVEDPNTGVAVVVNGQWFQFGGNDGAPIIASAYALAGSAPSPDAAQSLYANSADLFDVIGGSDGQCAKHYLCNAVRGYDGPTGNGTPNGIGAF
jgi:hypothetical protein